MELGRIIQNSEYQQSIVNFKGLNRTEGCADGEFTDTKNMACYHFPSAGTRKGRVPISTYAQPTDLFEWNGHLVVVANSVLYYDGAALANVESGQKQFAVVNTKLIIWPDQTYIDLSTGYYGAMDAETQLTITGMTETSITAQDTSSARDIQNPQTIGTSPTTGVQKIIYTYGQDLNAISWNAADGWTLPEPTVKGLEEGTYPLIEAGDIIIPSLSGNVYAMVIGEYTDSVSYDTSGYNNSGYYGIYKNLKSNYTTSYYNYTDYYVSWGATTYSQENVPTSFSGRTGYYLSGSTIVLTGDSRTITGGDTVGGGGTLYSGGGSSITQGVAYADCVAYTTGTVASRQQTGSTQTLTGYTPVFTLGRIRVEIPKLSELFVAGDRVSIYGCANETNNIVNQEILSFDDSTGTITFAEGTFSAPFEASGAALTIKKEIPPLAFICSRNNRLYGVSNSTENRIYNKETGKYDTYTTRCIYVSALGLPDRFWDFDGVDTDSYQVAVASNGDFTAICEMGDYVLAWKENELVQIYGDYPSNFGYNMAHINGVQAGSHRSMAIINEVLYYKGTDGIYAYALSTPQLVSYNLGWRRYTDATAGADGVHYHISMKDEDGLHDFYTYDTVHGLWMREDDSNVVAFSLQGGKLYAIIEDTLYILEAEEATVGENKYFAETFDWYAVFPAFQENAIERKEYKWLRLRVRLGDNATIKAEISLDGRDFTEVKSITGTGWVTINIPLPVNRVDRAVVRLSGTGAATIQEMVREFAVGSAVW